MHGAWILRPFSLNVCSCTLLQGQNRSLLFTLHCLAGLVPEPVRYYCANVRCIVDAYEATIDPMRLLEGLYRCAPPEELTPLASAFSGKQLLPEVLKMKLVDQTMEHVITGQEIRHRKWSEVCKTGTALHLLWGNIIVLEYHSLQMRLCTHKLLTILYKPFASCI